EQNQVYNANNFAVAQWTDPNATISGVGVSTLWCPSDGSINGAIYSYPAGTIYNNIPVPMRYSNYKGSIGYWTGTITGGAGADAQGFQGLQNQNGAIVSNGYGPLYAAATGRPGRAGIARAPMTLAGITDGTSNTISFGEFAHGLLSKNDYAPGSIPPGS